MCFDAHLRWTNGDASVEPRRRRGVKNAFAGEVARRPRPAPRSPQPTPMATGAGAVAPLPPPSASLLPDSESSGASVLVSATEQNGLLLGYWYCHYDSLHGLFSVWKSFALCCTGCSCLSLPPKFMARVYYLRMRG